MVHTMDNFKDSTNNHFLDFTKDQKHLNKDLDTSRIINFTYLIESVKVNTLDDYNAFFEDDGGY